MHYQSYQVLSHAATLVVEGRVPVSKFKQCPNTLSNSKALLGYGEGPHCPSLVSGVPQVHKHACLHENRLCLRYHLFQKGLQEFMCKKDIVIEVYIRFGCVKSTNIEVATLPHENDILLERWTFKLHDNWSGESTNSIGDLFNALRSSIHFSQLSSWLVKLKGYLPFDIGYRLCATQDANASHQSLNESTLFPILKVDINSYFLISLSSLRRLSDLPSVNNPLCYEVQTGLNSMERGRRYCQSVADIKYASNALAKTKSSKLRVEKDKQNPSTTIDEMIHTKNIVTNDLVLSQRDENNSSDSVSCPETIVDDRMLVTCEISGKHHCHAEPEEYVEIENDRPKRRRSVSRPSSKTQDVKKTGYVFHGKFREIYDESRNLLHSKHHVDRPNPFMAAILRSNKKEPLDEHKRVVSIAVNTDISFADYPASAEFLLVDFSSVSNALKHSNVPLNLQVSRAFQFSEFEEVHSKMWLEKTINQASNDLKNKHRILKVQGNQSSQRKNLRLVLDKTASHSSKDFDETYSDELRFGPQISSFSVTSYPCGTDLSSEKYVSIERPVVPSAKDQLTFRRSLESATHMIFHRHQGLPLLSSSAPRGCTPTFDYDSSLNSVSALKIALVGPMDGEPEPALPTSPGASAPSHGFLKSSLLSPLPMLGCFEESVLHGRIEPVSTVHGFTADVAASGSFIPPHLHLPVTVFFYSLSENDKVTTPYLSHINLVEKGYNIPRAGTIQVTLFNPLKTVVKMFIVPYDLQDMPPNSCTFLRQRTRYESSSETEENETAVDRGSSKFSRYLIHLRFCSSKSGKIYLHTDIRMLISRKTDADTALEVRNIGFDLESYELRSSTYGPTNPKYSLKH